MLNKELERLHKELENKEWSFDRDPIIHLISKTLDMLRKPTYKVTDGE